MTRAAETSADSGTPGVSEAVFLDRLQNVLGTDVSGVDAARKADVLRAAAGALDRLGQAAQCRIVPFVPGRRPQDEAAHPGLGSS